MKLIARFFLILFIAFLSTPAIVKMIEKSTDTSVFFSVSEEEQLKKEVKKLVYFVAISTVFELKETIKKHLIIFENLSKCDNIFKKIFSPPPNFA